MTPLSSRKGFALVELMVALVIMAVGLIGVSATMAQMQKRVLNNVLDGRPWLFGAAPIGDRSFVELSRP